MSDRYRGHIDRHRFTILDGRVTLNLNEPVITNGNYGDVYMGSLESLQADSQPETVAVKMIRGRSIKDSDIRVRHVCSDESSELVPQKFLKEVHTWSRLDYTNNHILPLFGITLDLGGTLSIISPWMAKGSAKKYTSDATIHPGPLLHDIVTALHYLHTEANMYHGDLKGDNILVSASGRGFLADFGFSVLVSSSFSLSISHPVGGTPLWMAPEKLAGQGDSAAADVYSFAMLILELFTRKDPFEGEPSPNREEVQNGRRPGRPTPDMTLNRLTDDWWKICKLCWAPNPSTRWTTVQIKEFISQTTFIATRNPIDSDVQTEGESIIETETTTKGPINLTFIRDEGDGHLYGSQILLTLTPAESVSYDSVEIAWKILTSDDAVERALTWTRDFGFCTIHQQEDGTIVPDSISVIQLGQMSHLVSVDGKLQWSASENGHDQDRVAASNQSHIPSSLALFIVDNAETYDAKYLPVVHLGVLRPGATISCGAPVKLQAYAVSGSKVYKERQIIEKQDLQFPLFSNSEGLPVPQDLQHLSKVISLRSN
ncbi:kinase-like domain-containing protein [Mycena vulgaris]|nr:kinase-like domain-containing protein [Mycena vulgaris]